MDKLMGFKRESLDFGASSYIDIPQIFKVHIWPSCLKSDLDHPLLNFGFKDMSKSGENNDFSFTGMTGFFLFVAYHVPGSGRFL